MFKVRVRVRVRVIWCDFFMFPVLNFARFFLFRKLLPECGPFVLFLDVSVRVRDIIKSDPFVFFRH